MDKYTLLRAVIRYQTDKGGATVEYIAEQLDQPLKKVKRLAERMADPHWTDEGPWLRKPELHIHLMATDRGKEALFEGRAEQDTGEADYKREVLTGGKEVTKRGQVQFVPTDIEKGALPTGGSKGGGRAPRRDERGELASLAKRLGCDMERAREAFRNREIKTCTGCAKRGVEHLHLLDEFTPGNNYCRECKRIKAREARHASDSGSGSS
jgi:hypothetical protein